MNSKEIIHDNVLEVKDLSISFGGLKAVSDVTFNLKKGELLGLIGPNGAGKTTLLICYQESILQQAVRFY